ncbi:MAG TPA: protein-glutamate O-methyltransferase CheR [Acetobacteraceae bacterium]|nr:protein-glutamate O-methyltransferase CheR [Acetobacteraceae bacterium]
MSGAELLPALSPDDLRRFCEFLYRRTGISYNETKRYYIERRVAEGMSRVGIGNFSEYLTQLSSGAPEAERLVNSFTVNETYFYREEHQLHCLGASMLPEIVTHRGPGDLVRIWCVPCSTGEEPYSVAIWLLENWALVDAYHIEIVGADIDTQVLEAAVAGYYGERALSRLSAELRSRYFAPAGEAKWRIIEDLRESVIFRPVNIVSQASMARQGRFDVILCRNVLIYFDDASRLQAAENLHAALHPGGFLCLGHSESMSRISDRFMLRRFPDAIVYQRSIA